MTAIMWRRVPRGDSCRIVHTWHIGRENERFLPVLRGRQTDDGACLSCIGACARRVGLYETNGPDEPRAGAERNDEQ